MNVRDAWLILGEDIDEIMQIMISYISIHDRMEASEEYLKKARKISKKLMAAHHPDRNSDDPSSVKRFKRVQKALEVIELETLKFKERAQIKIDLPINHNRIIIEKEKYDR